MEVTEVSSVSRATEFVCQFYYQFIYKVFTKNSYQESVHYTSVALCAVDTSVTLHYLRPLRDSVCLLYKRFSLSIHIRKNIKNSKTSTQKSPN